MAMLKTTPSFLPYLSLCVSLCSIQIIQSSVDLKAHKAKVCPHRNATSTHSLKPFPDYKNYIPLLASETLEEL
jgi:hypothetical protein